MSISTQENIRLNRNIWLTILFAAIVSRIIFYALGLWGVDSFVTGKYAEQPVWQTICRFDCVWFYRIIHDGYDLFPQWLSQNNAANWAFMPLQPFLGWVFSHLA